MHWSNSTISVLNKLHNNEKYAKWSEAIKNGQVDDISNKLEILLNRLTSILIAELEINPNEADKIVKILELAAVGGQAL